MIVSEINAFPSALYSTSAIQAIEQQTIHQYGIPGYTLMRRAGQACFELVRQVAPQAKHWLVLCGAGNNAGDGYVIARLAKQSGCQVSVLAMVPPNRLKGDAALAAEHWQALLDAEKTFADSDNAPKNSQTVWSGEAESVCETWLTDADVVVDALLGTGLQRDVEGDWAALVRCVNRHKHASATPVIAVDVPSGLDADSGQVKGVAVHADHTVSFIGLKAGLFTGAGPACCGHIHFDDLQVPDEVMDVVLGEQVKIARLSVQDKAPLLAPRMRDAHKGQAGHVLIVGGNDSMPGALILAARAALRSGAGLVSVFTRDTHLAALMSACPEVMVYSATDGNIPVSLFARVTCVAIGPGLGQDDWARNCLLQCLSADKPRILDADALNLLSGGGVMTDQSVRLPDSLQNCVLTPHPGEAARLLGVGTKQINDNRYQAVRQIHQRWLDESGVVVLKGAGSLIDNGCECVVCSWGNPAMATAGMGDVLTGVIAALIAQGLSNQQAAEKAVLAHALAGDQARAALCASVDMPLLPSRGLLASDVIECLPCVL